METGSKGPPLRLESLAAYLDDRLEHETQVLDLLVVAQARGQTNQELWDKLHSAALRDDRLSELAFAYEKLGQDRRVRIMPPANQAQIFLNSARFFTRALGDIDGAQTAFERVLALVPGHPDAFEQLRRILEDKGDKEKLVALYLGAVGPKTEKEPALEYLRAALAIAAEADPASSLKIAQQILKLEPSDSDALDAMCAGLEAQGKFPDLARALEQALAADPPPSAERRLDIRLRLLDIYDDKVPELERSIPHVEELLLIEPENQLARKLAGRLLTSKAMGARAAAALEKVYESEGDRGGVAQMLGIQIEQLRGPKRAEAQKKLGLILYELGDDAPAFSNFEAVLTVDPSDDEARDKYVELARKHGKQADASKVLSRCAGAVKDPEKRARINLESARFLAELGDPKRARVILQGVLDQAEGETALEAARTMRNLVEEPKALAPVLEAIAKLTSDPEEKLEVLRELARMYEGDLKDLAGAIQARKRVLELDPSAEPEELERLLEARGDFATLAEVLEIRTSSMEPTEERREMLLRAARLKAEAVQDVEGAIHTLMRVRLEHGATRDVNQLLLPMLEQGQRHDALIDVLSSELELAEEEEKPSLMARLADSLLAIGNLADCIAALGEVVTVVPGEERARARLTQLLSDAPDEPTRLAVALILAPIQREEGDGTALVKSLDVIATAHAEPAVRLEALAEAQSLVDAQGKDKVRALLLAGRGLREAVQHDVEQVPAWLERIGPAERGPTRVAVLEALAAPLRERAIDHPNIARLAQRSAEAYAAAGDLNKAIDTYRRVLEFEPDNEEVMERIDHCLAEKGSPEERITLYRASLERPGSVDRKRTLFLSIARVQAESQNDRVAAAKSLREGLAELPGDRTLRDALLEVLEGDQKYPELYEELLVDRDAVSGGDASLLDLRLAMVAVAAGDLPAALRHYRDALAEADLELSPEDLDPIEALANEQVDVPLLVAVAERRVAAAEPGEARAKALEHLGALVGDRGGDPARAAQHLFEAAEEALALGDRDRATHDYERVLAYRPDTKAALERLIGIHGERGETDLLLRATERFVRLAEDRREALEVVSQLAGLAESREGEAGRVDDVLALVMLVEERFSEATETVVVRAALLESAGRVVDAAALLSGRLKDADAEVVAALRALLDRHAGEPALLPIERQLLDHAVKHAEAADRKERALALFRFERDRAKEPNRAAVVLDELLEADPRDAEVLSERYALALSQEDFAIAASCLSRVMESAEDDEARGTAAVEIASLRFSRLSDVAGALDVIEPYVAGRAGDAVVRQVSLAALSRPELAPRAVAILEQVAETIEDLAERATIYRAMFDHSPPGAMGDSEPLLFNAWLACLEDDAVASLEVAALAAVRVPENEAFWDRAEELAQAAKRPNEVAAAYRKVLSEARSLPEEVALRIGERGVAFHEEWFDDQELVMELLRLVVDVAPSATWAFERLKLFYNAGERWSELFELYDRVIAAQSDDEAKSLILEDAAEISRDLAGDHDRAISYLEMLLALRREDSRLEAQLERLYERHNKTESLIKLLDARLPKLSDDDGRGVRLRIAGLWETSLADLSQALSALRPLVEQSDDEATNIALRFIEQTEPERKDRAPAYRALSQPTPNVAEVRIAAAQLLAPIYAVLGADEKNARMLTILLESQLERGERLRILRSLVERRAHLGHDQLALEAVLAELALGGSDAREDDAALDTAELTAGDDKARLAYLVDALLDLGEDGDDKERSLRLLRRASTVAHGALADESRAITADLAILSRSDGDKAAAREAAKKLDRDLRAAKREADRASVLEKLADLEPTPAEKRACLIEAAEIAETIIGDRQRALRALRRWLADVPNDLPVLTKVVDNLRQVGDSRGLVDALDARAQCTTDPEDAESDRVEIARLWSRVIGDKASAIDAYRVAIEKHGSSVELVDELADLLEDEKRDEELAKLLASEAALGDGERKANLLARLGDTQRRRALYEESLAAFVESLKLIPASVKAQSGLETLIGALSPVDPATQAVFARGVTALAKSFEQAGQTDRWLALVPARLLATKNDLEKCDLLLAAAKLEEEAAKNPVRALEKTAQAFSIRAEFPGAADALLARGKATGRWDLIAPLLLPALATREDIPLSIARDLLVLAADWASGELNVPTPVPQESRGLSLGLLAAAHTRAPGDEEVLVKLIALRRRAPSRDLVENLLSLARLRDGDIQLLEEAASAALREVGDDDWGLAIADELYQAAAKVLAAGADRAAEEALVWAIDVLEPMLDTRRETDRVKTILLAAAALPIDKGRVRSYLFAAAKHCEPEEAVSVYERLYAGDPSETASAEALVELYAQLDRKQDLARLYASMADTAQAKDERARLRLLSAELSVELGAPDKAIPALRQSLAELAVHEPSVALLAKLLEQKSAWGDLTALLESQADLASRSDAPRAIAFYERAATLSDEKLKDVARASRSFKKLVDLDATTDRLDRLASLFERSGQHSDEAAVLERLEEMGGASDELSLRMATAFGRAGQVERARDQLERAVAEGRGSARVREVLAEIYRKAGAWEPLAKLFESEAEAATDVAAKVDKLRDAASIYAKELGRSDDAATVLRRAIELKPDDLTTMFALAEAYRVGDRVDEARDILGRILAEFGTRKPKERALVHYELAKLALSTKDRTTALSELDAASKIDPAHSGVLALLADVALEEGQYLRAQRTYRALLLVLRSQRGDKGGSSVFKAQVLIELAFIADRQKEAERKTEFVESAFEAAKDDAAEYDALLAALERRGYFDMFARALEKQLEKEDLAEAQRTSVELSLADVYGRRLARTTEAGDIALRCFERTLISEVGATQKTEVETRVIRLLSELSLLTRLFDALHAIAGKLEGDERVRLLSRAAAIAEHDLRDDARTADTLEAVLAAWEEQGSGEPQERAEVLARLDEVTGRLFAAGGPVERHVAALERVIDALTNEGASFAAIAEPLYRLVVLHEGSANADAVHGLLERALREDADGDRLEAALREATAKLASDTRFARLLEDFGREKGRKRAVVDALELLANSSADPVPTLREAYEIAEELEDPVSAERLLRKIVPASPEDDNTDLAWALSALAEVRFAASDAREAATLWERAAKMSDPDEERSLLLRVADLTDRVLGEAERAVALYETLRKREPADREVWQPLADLHRRRGDTEALAQLMDETIPLIDDLKERAAMRLTLAQMLEVTDPDRAAEVLAEAIEEDPQSVEAATLLERLYEATGRDDKLIILLERQLDVAKDAADKARVMSLYLRVGELRERLKDEDAALDAYHGALDWDDRNLTALRSAVRLHTQREDSIVLGDLLDKLLEIEQGDDAVELSLKVADMKLASGDPPGAERALLAGFKANGRNPQLKQRLTALYEERGDRVGLARLSAGEARFMADGKLKRDLLLAAAETIKSEGDQREAADLYAEAIALDTSDRDALFAFMEACANTSQHARAIGMVDDILKNEPNDPWLLFSRAVLREATGESDAALDDLEAAFDASQGQYAAELRAHLEAALVRVSRDPGASRRSEAQIRLRLAEVSAASGDVDSARIVVEELLHRNPQDVAALATMARIEELAGRDDAAAMAYARSVGLMTGPELSLIAMRLFDACQRIGQLELARAGLERALGADPQNGGLRSALRLVYEDTGAIAELADLVVEEAHALEDVSARFDKLLEAARLLLYGSGEVSTGPAMAERASGVLEEARQLRPDDHDMLQLSSEALAAMGRGEEARTVLTMMIAAHKGKRSRELGQAYYSLYRVEAKGGNLTEALEALTKAFDNQPQNGGIALELGQLAIDLDEQDVAQRAFRAVTLMKVDGTSGVTAPDRAIAYYHLGSMATRQGDNRRAKLMLEKSLAEDPTLEAARELLGSLG